MIQLEKLRDLKRASQGVISADETVAKLFENLPELKHFKFCKFQEYDDNNYFDNIRTTEINGHSLGYYGYDEEGEEGHSDLPKIQEIHLVETVVDMIAENYDRTDETEIVREDYEGFQKSADSPDMTYLASYLSGSTLAKSFFIKNDPKWAVYYALDHGRFDERAEFKIFARKEEMHMAFEYAKHVIKGRLPSSVENFFILDCDEYDRVFLEQYLEFVKNVGENEDSLAVLSEVHKV